MKDAWVSFTTIVVAILATTCILVGILHDTKHSVETVRVPDPQAEIQNSRLRTCIDMALSQDNSDYAIKVLETCAR